MKKTIMGFFILLIVIALSSFISDGESVKKGCDASNHNSCVISNPDGSKVDATGYAYVIETN
ncbi:MAG: hypothetical protein QM610_02015 [Chitinophagaceae bacterium]